MAIYERYATGHTLSGSPWLRPTAAYGAADYVAAPADVDELAQLNNGTAATVNGNLDLSFDPTLNRAQTIRAVSFELYWTKNTQTVQPGLGQTYYSLDAGASWTLLFSTTAAVDFLTTPQTFDISGAVGQDWDLLDDLQIRFLHNASLGPSKTMQVDAVHLFVDAAPVGIAELALSAAGTVVKRGVASQSAPISLPTDGDITSKGGQTDVPVVYERSAESGATSATSSGTWTNKDNALGQDDSVGNFATSQNSATVAASGYLILAHDPPAIERDLTVTSVELELSWQSTVTATPGSTQFLYTFDGGSTLFTGVNTNVAQNYQTPGQSPQIIDITADVLATDDPWAALDNLQLWWRLSATQSPLINRLFVTYNTVSVTAERPGDATLELVSPPAATIKPTGNTSLNLTASGTVVKFGFDGEEVVVDGIGALDAASAAIDGNAELVDSAGVSDTFVAVFALASEATDGLGVSDTPEYAAAYDVTDSLGSTDFPEPALLHELVVADGLGTSDPVGAGAVSAHVDSVGSSDFLSTELAAVREFDDDLGATDPVDTSSSFRLAEFDGLRLTGAASAPAALFLVEDDTTGLADYVATTEENNEELDAASPVPLADSVDLVLTYHTEVTDTAGLADSVASTEENVLEADTVGLSDLYIFDLVAADTVGLSDTVLDALDTRRSYSDFTGLSDASAASTAANVLEVDAVGATDTVVLVLTYHTEVVDTSGLTDLSVAPAELFLVEAESAGLSDLFLLTEEEFEVIDATDTLGATDTIELTHSADVADTAGLADASVVTSAKDVVAPDTVGATDTALDALDSRRSYNDPAELLDVHVVTSAKDVVATDIVGATDTVALVLTYHTEVVDTSGLTDLSVAPAELFLVEAESAGLSDLFLLTEEEFEVLDATDTLGATDTISDVLDARRVKTDTTGMLDAYVVISTKEVDAAFYVGVTDTDTVELDSRRIYNDSAELSDASVVTSAKAVVTTDTVGATDTVALVLTYHTEVVDTSGINDLAATESALLLIEPIGLSDLFLLTEEEIEVLAATDTVGATDTVEVSYSADVADTAGLVDVPTAATSASYSDSAGLSDVHTASTAANVLEADTVGLADDHAADAATDVADSTGITDSAVAPSALFIVEDESVGLSDLFLLTEEELEVLDATDTVGLSDTVLDALDSRRIATDDVELSDAHVVSSAKAVVATDTAELSDAHSVSATKDVVEADTVGMSDTVELTYHAEVVDSAGLTDLVVTESVFLLVETDTVGLSELFLLTEEEFEVLDATDTLGATDTAVGTLVSIHSYRDSAGLSDTHSVSAAKDVAATDTVGMSDTVVLVLAYSTEVVDDVGLLELTPAPTLDASLEFVALLGLLEVAAAYNPTGTGFFFMHYMASLYVGDRPVQAMYYGDSLVWTPPPS
jgi:hypothetical protein